MAGTFGTFAKTAYFRVAAPDICSRNILYCIVILQVATCRSSFSVQPKLARALLFYSQTPDGLEDLSSKYSECPLFSGTKVGTLLVQLTNVAQARHA